MSYPKNHYQIKQAALPLAVAVALMPMIGLAQESPSQQTPSEDELDVVTVTGSRIPRSSEVEGTSPVLTIDRAAIEATGLTSVGDILFNITASDDVKTFVTDATLYCVCRVAGLLDLISSNPKARPYTISPSRTIATAKLGYFARSTCV